MNIDEYRALIADEKSNQNNESENKIDEKPIENTDTDVKTDENTNTNVEENKNTLPEVIEIEGVGEVTVDELKKGYLRTSDYTKKTQKLARQVEEANEAIEFYENVKSNPELLDTLKEKTFVPRNLDPIQSKIMNLENRVYDLMLQNEIITLQNKYDDFDVKEVLETAHQKNINDLEDAYLLVKSQKIPKHEEVNIDELKKKLREEILEEVKNENGTRTIISPEGNEKIIEDNEPKLSEAEKKVARNMFIDSKNPYVEYAKWRDK